MRTAVASLLLLALALSPVGCGSGSAAKAARDDVPTASKAMGDEPCMVGEEAVPWTFDMDGTTRGSLFSAMDSGLVVVSFDCKKLKVMSRCKATGNYEYGYYPSEAEVLDFKDSDEIKANLSGGAAIAAKFEAEMKRGAKLFIAYAVGGRSTTTVPDVGRDQIKGPRSCDKATHYVAEVHFGAYKMEASSGAEMKAAVDIFGRGASGGSQSSADTSGKSGDPQACERGSDRDREAPRGCNTVVRVTLAPILPAGEGQKPEAAPVKAELPRPPPGCPPGMERIGMMCRRPGGATGGSRPRMCRPGDAADCERQCQAGEPVSCAVAGAMYERGTGVRPSAQTAFKYYKQACAKGNIDGCTGQAYLYSKGEGGITEDGPKAEKMFTDACKRGNGRACSGLGQRLRLKGSVRNALPLFARGCQLGYARACFYQGSFGSTTTQSPEVTLKAFERACFGRDLRGCLGAATVLKTGKAGDPGKANMFVGIGVGGLEKACSAGDGESCKVLGDWHGGKYDPQTRDPGKARTFYEQACRAGQKDACKADLAKGPPPGKGPPSGRKPLPPPPPPPRKNK
ncbi:MAG TPA: tetratricopeptide repeat protein [Kofleriaceae bacterium]|nr:tetratricopeptide repeat protein [Kofleriaceae bacterium]